MKCPVCRGAKVIRLPLRREAPLDSSSGAMVAEDMAVSIKTYPCPECAPTADEGKVKWVETTTQFTTHPNFVPPRVYEERAAHEMVDLLLNEGMIRFAIVGRDDRQMTETIRGRLAVVVPGHVASMEERIAKHQERVAAAVVAEAEKQIDEWNYGRSEVYKEQAKTAVRLALKKVLREVKV